MFKIVRRGLPIRIVEDIRDLWAFRFMSIAEEKGIEMTAMVNQSSVSARVLEKAIVALQMEEMLTKPGPHIKYQLIYLL